MLGDVVYNGNDIWVVFDIIFGVDDEIFQLFMDDLEFLLCYYL